MVFGELTGVGPLFILPSLRLRVGEHDRVQFGFGMADDIPFWTSGGFMHWEGIFAIPRTKCGPRDSDRRPAESYPQPGRTSSIELYGESRHASDTTCRSPSRAPSGTGSAELPPSFTAAVRIGTAFGKGVRSGIRPQPVD